MSSTELLGRAIPIFPMVLDTVPQLLIVMMGPGQSVNGEIGVFQ